MTGNRHSQGVRGAGSGHRPHRPRRSDPGRDLAVGRSRAGRDLAQRLPHPLLEGRTADIQRQVESHRRRLDESDDAGHEPLEPGVAADQRGPREPVLELPGQRVGVIAQENGAHPALAPRHQDRAERAFADGEADLGVGAAGAVVDW